MNKPIFVVLSGEKHEGGDVVSVHSSFEKAKEAALNVKTCFDGGWLQDYDSDLFFATNGCDFVCVQEHILVE